MQDRVSLYPGRVKLEPVAGQANLYDLTRADQPTQEGTPLNKATLLKDSTAAVLGLPKTAVPDDALVAILIGVNKYAFRLTVTFLDGTPVVGKTVTGLTSLDGTPAVTDEAGQVLGVSSVETVKIGINFSDYLDIDNFNTTLTATAKITDTLIKISSSSATEKTIASSGTYRFSSNVKDYDVAAIGGGGGGGKCEDSIDPNRGGSGGGGGSVANAYKQTEKTLTIQIGAGGTPGESGGNTTINEIGLTASGGSGGKDDGSVGSSVNGGQGGKAGNVNSPPSVGTSRSVFPFDDAQILSGGGGGGGAGRNGDAYKNGANGGASFGGKGANFGSTNTAGEDGQGYGGGGGGMTIENRNPPNRGGKGYQGAVMLRWRFVAA